MKISNLITSISFSLVATLCLSTSATAADNDFVTEWAEPDAAECKTAITIETSRKLDKNGNLIKGGVSFVVEELTIPCMKKNPVVMSDIRYAFLYYIEENYPEKLHLLKKRTSASSTVWYLPKEKENYERNKNNRSQNSTSSNYEFMGYEAFIISDFVYEPGIYYAREDQKAEWTRIFNTYINHR